MQLRRVELHDGTQAVINTTQVTWLEARDPRTTRVHFAGSNTIHVKGSVTEVARQLSSSM
jgi:uncharacterized protein YecT (DUF1311 family)